MRNLFISPDQRLDGLHVPGVVLFGFLGTGQDVRLTCFTDTDYAPTFSINTSTAFSGGV